MACPVIASDCEDARNKARSATSSGRTIRFNAVARTYSWDIVSKSVPVAFARARMTDSINSVFVGPGQMAFTCTLYGPNSWAKVSLRPRRPHLEAAYGV